MTRVVIPFFDLQDGAYEYKDGDIYPRKGYTPSESRINELASTRNKLGKALIQIEKEEAKPKKTKKSVEQ